MYLYVCVYTYTYIYTYILCIIKTFQVLEQNEINPFHGPKFLFISCLLFSSKIHFIYFHYFLEMALLQKGKRYKQIYTAEAGQFFPVPHIIKIIIHFLSCGTINFSLVVFNPMTLKGFSHNRKRGEGLLGFRSCKWKDSPIPSQSSESELIFSVSEEAKDPYCPKMLRNEFL